LPHPVQHTDANDFVTLASWTSASCRRTVYTVYDEVLRRRQTTSPKCHTVGRRQLRHSSFFFLRFPLMPFCAGDQSFPPSTPTPAGRSREVRAVSRGVPVFVYFSLTLDELAVQWRIRVETRRRLSLGDRDTPAMRLQFDRTTTFLSCVRLYSTQSAILIYRFCLFF